jgi:hypothetical protein
VSEDVSNILGLLLAFIFEQVHPISSLNMGLDHFKVIFIDGQLFEELPASFFVMAYHQASQQQLNITDSLNKYLSKLFGLFFHLNALNAYFFHFFFRSFELFPYGTNSGLIEHNIGYVFNGLSFKLYHNK